jgi:hypothetical protein
MSPEQQLEKLRRLARLAWLPHGLSTAALVLLGVALFTDFDAAYVASAFIGLAAVGAHNTAPHYRNAIEALVHGACAEGSVNIHVSEWDGVAEYHAEVTDSSAQTWSFRFSPQGWTPKPGKVAAELFHLGKISWPVLLVTQEGIMFPAFKPDQIQRNTSSTASTG